MEPKFAEFALRLGARIVQLRKEHSYAQERLATLARMNKGYLSSVESGQRVPSVGMLVRLAKVLGVQLSDLFVFPESSPQDQIREEVRVGQSNAVEELRASFGVFGPHTPKASTKPAVKVRQGRAAAASAKRKSSGRTPARSSKTKERSSARPGGRRKTKSSK